MTVFQHSIKILYIRLKDINCIQRSLHCITIYV